MSLSRRNKFRRGTSACGFAAGDRYSASMPAPADWTPPPTPDPKEILEEAREDAAACRYELALAKHVWFHRDALRYEKALYGVRLSYALDAWADLAKVYPPALVEMENVRNEAESRVRAGGLVREAFHDFRSLNDAMGESEKTLSLFAWLDIEAPDEAKTVFDLARPALIRGGMVTLCGRYLDDDYSFRCRVMGYQQNMRLAEDPKFGEDFRDFGIKHFSNETATLVALLVLNDRREEAAKIAAEALEVLADPSFEQQLEEASQGRVPEPWP